MRHAIPRPTLWALAVLGGLLLGCSHNGDEDRLAGYWEGTLPLPVSGDALPVAYDFRAGDGLTVTVGLGENRTVTEWDRWEIHSADDGDIVVYIYRRDGRVFSTLARYTADDALMLWDLGTEETTAAHVRRVARPGSGEAGEGSGEAPRALGAPSDAD